MGSAGFELKREPLDQGRVRLSLSGEADMPVVAALSAELDQAVSASDLAVLVDLSALTRLDGAAASVLYGLRTRLTQRSVPTELIGARGDVATILSLYDDSKAQPSLRTAPAKRSAVDQVGEVTWAFGHGVQDILAFVGEVTASCLAAIRRPASIHWADLGKLMERSGADALPIVALISFLIGLVMAFQSAGTLETYGANIYIADMVGLSMTRVMGPLMMAILVAGRSGAGFAAELGTMKVSEEIDALKVLGVDPVRFLVIPRVLALVLMVPLLTLLADLVGVVGGGLIGVSVLQLTPAAYVTRLGVALSLWDIGTGLILSLGYGVAIGMIACERGLATAGGAEGVGRYTTSAVVTILFHLVIITAVGTILFQFWGI